MIEPPAFSPGFRILPQDKFIAAGAVALTSGFYFLGGWPIALIFFVVVFQFFLFCNVFRVQTKRELAWVGLTAPVVFWGISDGVPAIPLVLWMLVSGVWIVFWETRDRFYQGVYWERINPLLQEASEAGGGGGEIRP